MPSEIFATGLIAPADKGGVPLRLGLGVGSLVGLLALELLAFRMWLDAVPLQGAGTLTALLAPRGPGTLRYLAVRCVVAFAMVSLIFGRSTVTRDAQTPPHLVRQRIAWRLLLAHLGVTLLFAWLSAIVFGPRLPAARADVFIALWIITGVTSPCLAALAFMPAAFWLKFIRSMRHVLAFALAVSIGAYAFARMALTLWQPLSGGTLRLAYAMLHPFVPAVIADPATFTIGAGDFQVVIDPDCSGYEGLGLVLVFTCAWLWFHRADWRFPQALVLVPGGLLAIWIINAARIAALVLIGMAGAPDVALGGFHSQAGWLGFTAVALGICLAARHVTWLRRGGADHESSVTIVSNPIAAYLVPFLAILAGSMVAQLGSNGFEWLYPIRVVAAAAAVCYFGYFARSYRSSDWRIGWTSVGLGFLVFGIWVIFEPLTGTGSHVGMPLALSGAPALWRLTWLTIRVLGAVVTVPIAEELAFRGFLLRRFDSADFQSVKWQSVSWLAIALSSLTFGVLHGDRWLVGTIAGVVYAAALLRRRSIGDAVAAHATSNALIAGWVLMGGHWQLW